MGWRVVVAFILVAFTSTFPLVGCGHPAKSLEQIALGEFAKKYLGHEVFDSECTGLVFDPTLPIRVFTSRPGYSISVLDVATMAGVDVKAAAMEKGGLSEIEELGVVEDHFGPVDITEYGFASASISLPENSWQPSHGYLLRFSNRLRFKDEVYLQLWIKAGYISSGKRISFKFDRSGHLLESQKGGATCDDWG